MPLDGIEEFWKAIRYKERPRLEIDEKGKFWLIWVGFFQKQVEIKRIPVLGFGPEIDPVGVEKKKLFMFDGCFFPLVTVVVDTMAVYSNQYEGPYLSKLVFKTPVEIGPWSGLAFRYYLEPTERRDYSIRLYFVREDSSRIRVS